MRSPNKKYQLVTISVLLALAMVTWQVVSGPIPDTFQVIFFVTAVFVFGIPHGALDQQVEEEVARRKESSFRKMAFSIEYWGAILVYALLWYLLPQLSLLAFLLMSAWHFGETDFQQMIKQSLVNAVVRLLYGMSILLWIIFTHTDEAGITILQLLPDGSSLQKAWLTGVANSEIILACSATVILSALVANQISRRSRFSLRLMMELIIILTCCYFLPLLPAFALYFVGWHSIITLYNIDEFINTSATGTKHSTVAGLCLKALPASLIAIGGLVLTACVITFYAPVFNPLPLLFISLSLITLPHIKVMHRLTLQL